MAKNVGKEKDVIDTLQSLPSLEANLEIAKMRVAIIQKALGCLTEDERAIMCRLIIKGESPLDISFDLCMEKNNFYKKRRSALEKLSIALFGNQLGNPSGKGARGNEKTNNTF